MSIDYEQARVQMEEWIRLDRETKETLGAGVPLDRGDAEIYGEKLNAMLAEAREVFIRTGVSAFLHSGDFAVGLCTPRGDLVASSCGVHFFAILSQLPVKYIVHHFLDEPTVGVHDGDIFYTNEALLGGLHNPDQFAIMPVFFEGELVAWTLAGVHQPETGAVEPGGMPISARSRFYEGMRLSPIKIGENFQIRRDLLDMMTNFVSRAPAMQEIDTRARCSSCDRLRIRLLELLAKKGKPFVHRLFRELLQNAEEGARRKIRQWRNGTYRTVLFMDTIGHSMGINRVCVSLTKKGETLSFDLTGTSPENDGSLQAFAHAVWGAAATYFFSYPFHDLPVSIGAYEPIHFHVPRGTTLNPGHDASVANAPFIGRLVVNGVHQVMSKLLYASGFPELCTASNGSSGISVHFAGTNQWGALIADATGYKLNTEGAGARSDQDGVDAYGFFFAHQGRAPDVENVESRYVFMHLSQKYRTDSCGFGKYRGGSGTYSALANYHGQQVTVVCTGNAAKLPEQTGLFGGYAANVVSGCWLVSPELAHRMQEGNGGWPLSLEELVAGTNLSGEVRLLGAVAGPLQLNRGDLILAINTGGHGYGDVLERSPQEVYTDWQAQIISTWTVHNVYRVGIDPASGRINDSQTERWRAEEHARRKKEGLLWEDFLAAWLSKRPPEKILMYYGHYPDASGPLPLQRS